ncbi:hypothetical protein FRB99_002332 [Tulasnella sp. 403]|nr:hypothetical protein FRB99_002332 [Tulasnella sp. 403]
MSSLNPGHAIVCFVAWLLHLTIVGASVPPSDAFSTSASVQTTSPPPLPSDTTLPPNLQVLDSSTSATYLDTDPQIVYGAADVCSTSSCSSTAIDPWITTGYEYGTDGTYITFHSTSQQRARESGSVPYLTFRFKGSAIQLYTITSLSSVGVFNVTIDGGVTWDTVYCNVTTDSLSPNHLTWARTNLDTSRTSTLILRFWADAYGPAELDGVDSEGATFNIQSFVVVQPDLGPTSSGSRAATSNGLGLESPTSSADSAFPSEVNEWTHSYISAQNRLALIIGLSIGIPLFLILLVLLALLLAALRRSPPYDGYGSSEGATTPSDVVRRKDNQNISLLDPNRASASLDDSTEGRTRNYSNYPGFVSRRQMAGPPRAVGSRDAAPHEAGAIEPFVGGIGLSRARRASRRAATAAAAASVAASSSEGHAMTLSSGLGGSSGEQGDSSLLSSDGVNEEELARQQSRRISVLEESQSQLPSILSDSSSLPPSPTPARSPPSLLTFPVRRAELVTSGSTAVMPAGHDSKEAEPRFSISNPTTEERPKSKTTSRSRSGSQTNDQDTTYPSLVLGHTPDTGHSPIASTPEPMPHMRDNRSIGNLRAPRGVGPPVVSPPEGHHLLRNKIRSNLGLGVARTGGE